MKRLPKFLMAVTLSMFVTTRAYAEDFKANVLGCVLTVKNVSDITVTASLNFSILFREDTSGPLQSIGITKYPGDVAWNIDKPENGRSESVHTKYFGLDERAIKIHNQHLSDILYRGITDGNVVVFFRGLDVDISRFLDCRERETGNPAKEPAH